MADLNRRQVVLHLNVRARLHHGLPELGRIFDYRTEEDPNGAFLEMLSIPDDIWKDMGEPATLTVTLEPGDLLTPDPNQPELPITTGE